MDTKLLGLEDYGVQRGQVHIQALADVKFLLDIVLPNQYNEISMKH